MISRQQIRDVAAIATRGADPRLTVFNGKHIDNADDILPVATVVLDGITAVTDMSDARRYSGVLNVVFIAEGDDGTLDDFIDPSVDAIIASFRTNHPTVGITFTGMEYDRDFDPGMAAASVTFDMEWS